MQDTGFIGDRLRAVRRERGFSQQGLAERSGISARFIAKIEQGNGQPGTSTIFKLAGALGVEPSHLLDRRDRLEQAGRDHGVLALRDAILTTTDLPGLGGDCDGEPMSLADLERDVDRGWKLYWRGRFGDLTVLLPPLITAARATEREIGTAACRPLAQAYQLAADLMVHTGHDDLAFAVTRQALQAANRGDDPLQYATLVGTLSWISLHQGRLADAERVARVAAQSIEPSGKVPLWHLSVYGALLLSAAAPAAAAGDADAVAGYMGEAAVAALRFTDGDRHDYNVSFGPTQLAMQRTHTLSVLEEPAPALKAAKRVNRADLLPISWGALHLDIAQSSLRLKRVRGAVDALWEAHTVSAEWARHQGLWRDSVASAIRMEYRLSERTRKLRDAAGLRLVPDAST